MNRKMVFFTVGQILRVESLLLLLPGAVSLIYREISGLSFLAAAAVAAVLGTLLVVFCRTGDHTIFAREGFAIVALAWILMSAVGALPFFLSREIPSYVDAFFETVSGFTTTGASILKDVESMSRGLLFWRSFTHWLGGMGVLVFLMAILPSESGRSIHIMRAEMPGPTVGKLVPRIRDTAKILYLIYIFLSTSEAVLLLIGGMPLFDSIVHTFGTAGTGGFGIRSNSIGGYSPYLQWVITVFMFLFGVNFNLYYLILARRFRTALKSRELWFYGILVLGSVTAVSINIAPLFSGFGETVRTAAFQVVSIFTTTGYSTADFNQWPDFSKTLLVILMFIGGCAGSTAGGIKVSRVMLILRMVRRDLKRMLHPRSVGVVKMDGKRVDEETLTGVSSYLAVYVVVFLMIVLLLSIEPFDFETTFTAAAACFNNIGPGFGAVGPTSSFSAFSPAAKLLLSLAMLLGRLEIFPILLAFSPSMWKKK